MMTAKVTTQLAEFFKDLYGTLALQVADYRGDGILGWYRHAHVNMISTRVCFDYFDALVFT